MPECCSTKILDFPPKIDFIKCYLRAGFWKNAPRIAYGIYHPKDVYFKNTQTNFFSPLR